MYSAYKLNKQGDNIQTWRTSFRICNQFVVWCPVLIVASGQQISQEAGKVVWYSHLLKNFPVCCDLHSQRLWHNQWSRSRCFFWNSLAFSMIQGMLVIWSLVLLPFLNPAWISGSSQFTYCWSLAWRILSITLLACVAKSLQSCPTLCDPIDGSPPGSAVPGILQARTLEWVAMSFSSAWKWKVKVKSLSRVQL